MAAITVAKADVLHMVMGGGLKIEVVSTSSAPSDGDTYVSKLANPSFALCFPIGDASGSVDVSTAISGKTVTIHDPVSSVNHALMIFGDSLT